MYINKLIKKQIILSVTTFIIVGLILLGSSYAIFTNNSSIAENQVIAVGDLVITYTNGNAINIDGISPMSDAAAAAREDNVYTFTIANTGSVPYGYTISLVDNPAYLTGGASYDASRVLLSHNYIRYSLNGAQNAMLSSQTNGLLFTGVLNAGDTITYNLRVWVAEAELYNVPNEALGSEIHLNINIDGEASKQYLANYIKSLSGTTTGSGGVEEVSEALSPNLSANTEYRYYGENPNNYIKFNNELWRVIGVFQTENDSGKLEERVKIIRANSIGSYSWDSSDSATNSGNGSNDWTSADLMKLLNTGYTGDANNNSLYYNKLSGTCYNGASLQTTSCNFTSSGLSDTAKNLIGSAKYYLGGKTSADGTVTDFYTAERTGSTWTGIVGLMYPSDYGYAAASSSCARTTNLSAYNATSTCHTANWLYNSEANTYTIMPDSTNTYNVWSSGTSGALVSSVASSTNQIKPVVYLKANTKKLGGNGSLNNPFTLTI